jgi:hypothetical protein
MKTTPTAETPANLEEALHCIRGDGERAAERFAMRQQVLLGSHLASLLGEHAMTRSKDGVQFGINDGDTIHPAFMVTGSLESDTCSLVGRVLLGECSKEDGLKEFVADVNACLSMSRLILADAVVQHLVIRPVTADLTRKDVEVALRVLRGLPGELVEEMRTRFGLETSAATLRDILGRASEEGGKTEAGASAPQSAAVPEQGNVDLPLGTTPSEAVMAPAVSEVALDPEQPLMTRFDEKAMDYLMGKVGAALETMHKDSSNEREGRKFCWMEGGLQFHINTGRLGCPPSGPRNHVMVFAHVFMGRVVSRYPAARRWARRRMGNNSVGLHESDLDLQTGRLTLQTSSMLRPEDMEGLETMLKDIRFEAQQFVRLLSVYHSLMPADWVLALDKAALNGGRAKIIEINAILCEPGRVARELLESVSSAELVSALQLANCAEDWKTQLALLDRCEREVTGPGRPSEFELKMTRCRALYRLGRWQAGLEVCAAIRPLPTDAVERGQVQCYLAAGHRGLKQWDEVLDVLRGADDEQMPRVHYHRAVALRHLGRLKEAEASYLAYVKTAGPDLYADREMESLKRASEKQQQGIADAAPSRRGC